MPDKYPDFEVLSQNETSGIDFRILVRGARDTFAIVAPHGGGIEPGTTEIADAVAAGELSFYAFEGLKPSGNSDLHITSTRFDEPMCLVGVGRSNIVVTIHGEDGDTAREVFLGGLDDELRPHIGAVLEAHGFVVRKHPDPCLQGREPENICNRGISGKGVQLELSRALRREMFSSLSREGRECKTPVFHQFVEAVRIALAGVSRRVCA